MGKCKPETVKVIDELHSLRGAHGLFWNGTQLIEIGFTHEIYTDRLIVRYNKPVAFAFISLPNRILDEKPEYFLLRLTLKGETDFIYGVTIMKMVEADFSQRFKLTSPIFFLEREKYRPDFLRLDAYSLKDVYRSGYVSEGINDFIQFFTSNKTLGQTYANLISEINVYEFKVVYATEGLMTEFTIDPYILLLISIPYIVLMIVFPIILFYLGDHKYGKLLDNKVVLLVGSLIRIVLSPFTGHAYDMEVWKFATRTFYESGEIALFSSWTSPPLFYYALILFYFPYALLYYFLGFNDWRIFYHPVRALESLFLKMPMIIADTLIFILLIKILHLIKPTLTKERTIFLSSIFFLNPYVIMISSVWGMFDSLAMLFIIAGIYLWLQKKYLSAGLLFTLSALTKWIGAAPLLFEIILLLCSKRFKTAIKLITASSLSFLTIFFLPFVLTEQIDYFLEVLSFRLGRGSDIITWHGITYLEYFRLQGVFNILPNWFVSNYFLFTFGLFATFLCVRLIQLSLKEHSTQKILLIKGTLLAFLVFYLTYHRINEQFLLWSIPLIPLLLVLSRSEEIKYPLLSWVMVGAIPGLGWALLEAIAGQSLTYMLFGSPGIPDPTHALRPYQAGFSTVFSFLCSIMIWLLSGVGGKISNFLFYRKKMGKIAVKRATRVSAFLLLLIFTVLISVGTTETLFIRIAPSLALAIILLLFFLVAPFVAAVVEYLSKNMKNSISNSNL
jgi:hypothetical protein